jgi:hypothetical protein
MGDEGQHDLGRKLGCMAIAEWPGQKIQERGANDVLIIESLANLRSVCGRVLRVRRLDQNRRRVPSSRPRVR